MVRAVVHVGRLASIVWARVVRRFVTFRHSATSGGVFYQVYNRQVIFIILETRIIYIFVILTNLPFAVLLDTTDRLNSGSGRWNRTGF